MTFMRCFILIALTFSVYSFVLPAPFKALDDQSSIVSNTSLRNPNQWQTLFKEGYFKDRSYYRPLVNLSFLWEYNTTGLNPFYYNLHNVMIHIINAFLVWMLVATLINVELGFWVALLFAIHPVQWESVANISGRAILLSTMFSLMALLFYFKDRAWAALIAFVAALLCKESAVILPGLIIVYAVLHQKKIGLQPFIWIAVLAVYALLRRHLGLTEMFTWNNWQEHTLGVATFLRAVFTDLRILILPLDMHFDRSAAIFPSFAEPELWITLIGVTIIGLILVFGRRYIGPMQYFCVAWFGLVLFPVSQIISSIGVQPGRISTAEHFLYLACVPVFIVIVQLALRYNTELMRWLGLVAIVFLVLVTVEQNIYAQNELAMVERSLRIQPHNARLQSTAGLIYATAGKYREAEMHFRLAVMENPLNPRYQISLGKSLCDQGRIKEGLQVYHQIKDAGGLSNILDENKRAAVKLLHQGR